MSAAAKTLIAASLVMAGSALLVFGNAWAPAGFALLPDAGAGPWLELILPFLPMALIAAGVAVYRR